MFVVPPQGGTTTIGHVPLSLVTQVYVSIGPTMPGLAGVAMMRLGGQQIWSLVQHKLPQHVWAAPHALAAARWQTPLPESVPPASGPPLSPPESLPLSMAAPEELATVVASAPVPVSSAEPLSEEPPDASSEPVSPPLLLPPFPCPPPDPPLLELPPLPPLPLPLLVMVGSTGDDGAASEPLIEIVDAAPLQATVVATASPTNPIGTQSKAKRRMSTPPAILNDAPNSAGRRWASFAPGLSPR